MKKLCKCLVIGGAVGGMLVGAATAYLTAALEKNNTSMTDVCCTKAKSAFKSIGNKLCM